MEEQLRTHKKMLLAMDRERSTWFPHWREVSDYFLPRRYPWLLTQRETKTANRRNRKLLDSTSTMAVRTLASGMMNGITSPARPWLRLRIAGFDTEGASHAVKLWLEEVLRRLRLVLAESNFYNSIAVLYLEWCTFGTAAMAIYEDFNDVIRCYNFPLGEFYISQDNSLRVNRLGRRFAKTLEQLVGEFGLSALSENLQRAYERGGEALLQTYEVGHIIERNDPSDNLLPTNAPYREVYWEVGGDGKKYLAVRPLYEWPCVTVRWELLGNDSYGTSPAIDALSDVIQLQTILLERAQGLQKMVRPPMIVDQQLRNRPTGLAAGGITYAATASQNFGAREAYKVNMPFQELNADIQELKQSIRETCHNNLFNMISQLETVRSATEIDARREEKLIHLGSVLERFYNEGLDPALTRIYGIMQRSGLLPDAPEEIGDRDIEVQYVSILSDAQKAASTISIERFFQVVGQASGVFPEARAVPNVEELLREYADSIGIKPKGVNSKEKIAELKAQEEQAQQLAATAEVGNKLASGAKVLSEADIGGGQNALQALL